MTRTKAPWRLVLLSYPCPACGAAPGEVCITTTGRRKYECHADRGRQTNRCPKCGAMTSAENNEGALCDRCALVRALEVERATTWKRRRP